MHVVHNMCVCMYLCIYVVQYTIVRASIDICNPYMCVCVCVRALFTNRTPDESSVYLFP